jgi:uracil phosphoribosyltransferase
MICEKINDDINNKKIILIDESVGSGNTMNLAIEYLLSKNVTTIYLTSIISSINNENLINNYKLDSIIYNDYINPVFPWGYDN